MSTVDEPTAASLAARSMRAVVSKKKSDWLALWAPNARIEDPVGKSALDPTGNGHAGLEKIEKFWDDNIAPNEFSFNIRHSYSPVGSDEVCNVGTITTRVPSIKATTITNGVFVYRVDPLAGKLVSLRAFYDFNDMVKSTKRFPKL